MEKVTFDCELFDMRTAFSINVGVTPPLVVFQEWVGGWDFGPGGWGVP